jgi:hypothetical protein
VAVSEDEIRAVILSTLSMHMPLVSHFDDGEEPDAYVGCSCGKAIYVGHITRELTARLAERVAETESSLRAARSALAACREVREAREA